MTIEGYEGVSRCTVNFQYDDSIGLTGRATGPWLSQLLCWLRKGSSDAISENHGLDLICNAWMHDRAVLEAPDLEVQALVWHTPAHLHAADTCACPAIISIKVFHHSHCLIVGDQIDKPIPKGSQRAEISWGVDKVVKAFKTLRIQHVHEH